MKKTPKQRSKESLDGLLKQILILQRGEYCEHCGSTYRLQGAHIFPKGKYQKIRFMPLNLLILCFPCHPEWCHRNPVEFTRWLDEKFPGRINEIVKWERMMPKIDLKEIRASLEIELKLVQGKS